MSGTRFLIVNADDFGQSPGVNRGIIEAHERGIVTSASMMVRWPAAAAAALYAREHPELSTGLHVDLSEWAYREDAWQVLYEVVQPNNESAVIAEANRQLLLFRGLLGRDPTHLDSHQHIHRNEPVRSVLANIAGELHIPLRHYGSAIHHCGSFYGQGGKGISIPDSIGPAALIRLFAELPDGFSELGCHPGYGEELDSMYCAERAEEVRTLCDPSVRTALDAEGIRLCSFHQWREELGNIAT